MGRHRGAWVWNLGRSLAGRRGAALRLTVSPWSFPPVGRVPGSRPAAGRLEECSRWKSFCHLCLPFGVDMDYEVTQDLPNHPCNPEMILSAWMYWVHTCDESSDGGNGEKSQSEPSTRQSARLIVSLLLFSFQAE